MSILSEVILWLGQFAVNSISSMGYFGVFFLMILESMIFPMPSELVMPFAGFLAYEGRFSLALVFLVSTLGSIVGSLISYYIGYYGGNKIVLRYGKYLFLNEKDLKKTQVWFNKKGERTIFIGRLIPVVRHLISIPAGIGKMDLTKFCIYTTLGALLWNAFLAYLGYLLGKNWNLVRHYTEPISIIVAAVIVIVAIYFVYSHMKSYKKNISE